MLDKEQIDNWNKDQLTMFEYWTPEDEAQFNDHAGKTPMQMVKEHTKASKQTPTAFLSMLLVEEEYFEWDEESSLYFDRDRYKPEAELKELADLVYVCFKRAECMGWDLDEALRRVHENNMGRMYQPDGTVKFREDGKVLKNPDYPKVDLKDLV